MNLDKTTSLTVAVLDFNRPKESERCLRSIKQFITVPHQVLFISNGGEQDYVWRFYQEGLIDTVIFNRTNWGCGIGMKQMMQSSLTDWVMLVQCDQYAIRLFDTDEFSRITTHLKEHRQIFCADLAGNQGQGRYSERAQLVARSYYLNIPDIDDIIGGPGQFANYKWTEQHIQESLTTHGLGFIGVTPLLFADNGKWSTRTFPCGGETIHATDTKILKILKPLKQRYDDFPNLKLNDDEWKLVLDGAWPIEGRIPEADKTHSFIVWPD